MSPIIAVDLGGTNIRVARYPTARPQHDAYLKIETLAYEGPQAVLKRMFEAIDQVIGAEKEGLRIGIGTPGPLDPYQGVILNAPNLPGWVNLPLRERLVERFGCPVAIGNDANMAALGEWRHGAGVGVDNLIYLTISTGIGGGVVSDGRLLLGARGLGAELGHMTVVPEGPVCSCGKRGHLEAVAAGSAIGRRAREMLHEGMSSSILELVGSIEEVTAVHVGKAAQEGDILGLTIIQEAGELIGRHVADLLHAFNPEVIVFGGGVSRLGDLLFKTIEESVRAHAFHPAYLDGLHIVPAALGDDAGLIGSMVLASEL